MSLPSPSPSTSSTSPPQPPLLSLFAHERFSSAQSPLLLLWLPVGVVIGSIRLFVGFHAFLVATLLRKANVLRGLVLRVMCALCGIVVRSEGHRDESAKVLVANHVTCVDHLAVDLLSPCVLASVWDIPNLLRWAFGYVDLGARQGRQELVGQAKKFIQSSPYSLLAFPESALTSGRVGLLRFSTWPFEVTDTVQPVAIRASRPFFSAEITVLGGAWWQDLAFFLFMPYTFIDVTLLPVMKREEKETPEEFALRVSRKVASTLSLTVTEYTSHDAVEAAKKHVLRVRQLQQSQSASARRVNVKMDPRKLDEAAMVIKQGHPSIPVVDIRKDLEQTNDPKMTIDRIKRGVIRVTQTTVKKTLSLSDPTEWRRLFEERKWQMIEWNRARYLETATRDRGDS